jgi:hypothetical protein
MDQKALQEKLAQPHSAILDRLLKFLELAGDAYLLYQTSLTVEKQDLLEIITSNRTVTGKNTAVTLKDPFPDVANRSVSSDGSPYRDRPRTLDVLLKTLMEWFIANPTASFEVATAFPDHDTGTDTKRKKGKLAA